MESIFVDDPDVAAECLGMENHIYADITGGRANLNYLYVETVGVHSVNVCSAVE
jgi:hypothetical protein